MCREVGDTVAGTGVSEEVEEVGRGVDVEAKGSALDGASPADVRGSSPEGMRV